MPRTRRRLSFIAVAASLVLCAAGCGGNQTFVGANPSGSDALSHKARPDSGGKFVAQYNGRFISSGCNAGKSGRFTFKGVGRAEYLREGTQIGKLTAKPTSGSCMWSGDGKIVSKRHPADSIIVGLSLNDSIGLGPCTDGLHYVVKRGTGRFANAGGSGTVVFSCTGLRHGIYLDSWSGTLSF